MSKGCGEEDLVKDLRVFTVDCEEVVAGEPPCLLGSVK